MTNRPRALRVALATLLLAVALPAGASDAVTYAEGIDVSHWQGTISWPTVKGAGKSFAFLKATQGTGYLDATYATNRSGANAVGIPVGAYHFADVTKTPTNTAGARAEAEWFVANAQPRVGDLPPVFDIEKNNGLGTIALTDWAMAWLERVRQLTGIYPMIYTSPAGWNDRFGAAGNVVAESGYGLLWVAHWTTAASPTIPANNWAGNGWTFWQYTSSGTVPGISGNVDLDRYNGTDPTPLLLKSLAITKVSVDGKTGGVQQDGLGGFCNGTCTATTRLSVGGALTTLAPNSTDALTTWTWGGDCAGAPVGGTCTLQMTTNRSVTITYVPTTTPITVAAAGTGSGTVASTPAGVSCTAAAGVASGTCSAAFAYGSQVTLTATPAADSAFVGWSGACTGTAPCVVTADAAKTATATFGPATYTLTMSMSGTGTGTITATTPAPTSVVCAPTCSAVYPVNTTATLAPAAGGTSRFVGWSGACTGSGACTPVMSANRAVTGIFALVVPRTLTPTSLALTVRKGYSVAFRGALATGDARCSVASQTVTLWSSTGTSALQSTRTTSSGSYAFSRKMTTTGTYSFIVRAAEVVPTTLGNAICGATTSAVIVVTVTL
ncbi:MAG: glycoside hydrolase family 25 protein [Actinomycetota bacterium]